MLRLLLLTLIFFAVVLADEAPARGAGWRMPLDGPVARGFRTTPEAPYSAGQRRGVDLAADPGASVRSACTGRVSFAGRVPGGGGALGVSVRCGRLTATHLGLSSVRVARGHAVRAGARLGVLGPAGTLRLGARVTTLRSGYLDPLTLIGDRLGPPPLALPPGGRAPRGSRPALPRVPVAVRAPARAPRPARTPAPARVPLAAWLGVGLLAAGVGCGSFVHRASIRRRVALRRAISEGA